MDPTLKELEISYKVNFCDMIGELHNLEILTIMTNNRHPNNLMENLKQNKKLRKLNLNSITLADYPGLNQLTHLESLFFDFVKVKTLDEFLTVPHKKLETLLFLYPEADSFSSFHKVMKTFEKKFPNLKVDITDDYDEDPEWW